MFCYRQISLHQKRMLRVYITILLLFSANCSFSQNWQRIHSPEGGLVTGLISHNGNLFASLLGGVYKSTNQALSWSEASTGLHSIMNNCLLSHHNRLLLGTDSGVYISDNSGVSWTHSSTGINYYNQPVRIMQFLNDGSDSIIAATHIGLLC